MIRREVIVPLVPLHPPCFPDQSLWVEWLVSLGACDSEWSQAGGQVILFEAGKPARFNYSISWCADCSAGYRSQMVKAERCRPSHLVVLERRQKAAEAALAEAAEMLEAIAHNHPLKGLLCPPPSTCSCSPSRPTRERTSCAT